MSELRPITYVASDEGGRIYEDHSIQTDRDSLLTATKVSFLSVMKFLDYDVEHPS